MGDIAVLLAELRGGQPPAAPYHPAAARRAARQAAREQPAPAGEDPATQPAPGDDPREATPT
jgi:hypothetical protein